MISHYELGNYELIDYYIRSTYRFLLKKEDLHQFQRRILAFIKKLDGYIRSDELDQSFKKLLEDLRVMEKDEFENRAFIYFDIISWLESKIQHIPIEEVIQRKARNKLKA